MSHDLQSHVRNFSIIAHIDHGKSTLADRFLEVTGAVTARESREQILDAMDLERERGITIKAHAVAIRYKADNGETYALHLIDTPGHVDFTYEVSRSLAACEGALLLVDATQGVEAQTIANVYLAIANNLVIIPVINKIDLPSADVEGVKKQIHDVLGLDVSDTLLVSAKEGKGVRQVVEAVIQRVPPPTGDPDKPLKALVFDSWFDNYQGVIVLTRVVDGTIRPGMKIRVMSNNKMFEITEVGQFTPKRNKTDALNTGEVGYVCANMREVADVKIGDTLTDAVRQTDTPFPGYKEVKPLVFCGLYSTDTAKYEDLPRCAAEITLERFLICIRAGNVVGIRIRLSVRVSRPVAHGNYPGAIGTGICSDTHYHRADCRLSRLHDKRGDAVHRQSGQASRRRRPSNALKSRSSKPPLLRPSAMWAVFYNCAKSVEGFNSGFSIWIPRG